MGCLRRGLVLRSKVGCGFSALGGALGGALDGALDGALGGALGGAAGILGGFTVAVF